jgi:hypothetical protein
MNWSKNQGKYHSCLNNGINEDYTASCSGMETGNRELPSSARDRCTNDMPKHAFMNVSEQVDLK